MFLILILLAVARFLDQGEGGSVTGRPQLRESVR